MKNGESQYSKAKNDSIVLAFSISAIVNIALAYVNISIWWGKMLFEVFSKLLVFLVSWKILSDIILKIKVRLWEKSSDNFVLKGKWYVIHFSENKKYADYVRLGSVIIKQRMDEYYFVEGKNYSHSESSNFSSWRGIGAYRLLPELSELSGTFDVVRGSSRVNTDGLHILTISSDRQSMVGAFYNVNCDTKVKPMEGVIMLFRDKEKLDATYKSLLEQRQNT